jgi:hypothetical protein
MAAVRQALRAPRVARNSSILACMGKNDRPAPAERAPTAVGVDGVAIASIA